MTSSHSSSFNSIFWDLKKFTYLDGFRCCCEEEDTCPPLSYKIEEDGYECDECLRPVLFDIAYARHVNKRNLQKINPFAHGPATARRLNSANVVFGESMCFDWEKLKEFVKAHATPKQVLEIFIVCYLCQPADAFGDLDDVLCELQTSGVLLGH